MGVWILVGSVALIAMAAIGGYYRLVTLRNRVQNAWSAIDLQLNRRHALIPHLIETAVGSMNHEREVLEGVTRARQQAIDAGGVHEQAEAENMLSQTLRLLFALTAADPELKADQNMLALQEELSTWESKIASARQLYNDQVMDLNRKIHQFPWNLIARAGGFRPAEYFIIDEPAPREAPKVTC